jgi:nucleotide-binding universal stress UspA family protein
MKIAPTIPEIAFRNVLVTTDLSPRSNCALAWGQAIARHYGSTLYVTHVISPLETALMPPEYWGSTQEAIEEAATRDMACLDGGLCGIRHKLLLQHGEVGESIASDIQAFGVDLLVMCTHGRDGFGRLLLGSITEEAFRRAPCPVLILGPKVAAPASAEPALEHILFATKFGPESLAAAHYALSLAREFGAGLTLLHVMNEENFEEPADPQVVLRTHTDRLHKIIPADAQRGKEPQYLVQFGNAAEQILSVAEEKKAGLIVMGAKTASHPDVAAHLASSVVHNVVAFATCPVLAVRG